MRRRRKTRTESIITGSPLRDMMTGLVFVLPMLIVALLGLYLFKTTGYKYDETEGVEETTAQRPVHDDGLELEAIIKATATRM